MGGSKTSTSTTQKTTIPKEIRQRGTKITNAAMNEYFDPASKYQTYDYGNYSQVGQDTTGQLNSYHTDAGNQINNANAQYGQSANNYQPYIGGANNAAATANSFQATGVNGPNFTDQNLQRFMNPYTQNVIDQGVRQIGDAMNTQRLNDQSRAATAGAFGGARHGVLDSLNAQNAMTSLNDFVGTQLARGYDQAVNQYNTDFSQGLQANAQNNAAAGQNYTQNLGYANYLGNMGKQVQDQSIAAGNAMLQGSDASMKLGNIITAQEQAQKDAAYEKGYLDKRNYPMEIYERLAGMNAMQPVNRTSTSSGTQSQSGGWLGPALGAVGSILGSDERIKENVSERDPEQVLGAFAAVRPVEYDYKADAREKHPDVTYPGRRRGFMAQDLEKAFHRPAGPVLSDGTKTVDIPNLLGDLVAAVHGLEKRTRTLKPKGRKGH